MTVTQPLSHNTSFTRPTASSHSLRPSSKGEPHRYRPYRAGIGAGMLVHVSVFPLPAPSSINFPRLVAFGSALLLLSTPVESQRNLNAETKDSAWSIGKFGPASISNRPLQSSPIPTQCLICRQLSISTQLPSSSTKCTRG